MSAIMKFSVSTIFKIALLAASHIPSMSLNLNTNLQAVAIRIQIQPLVTVCSLYLPPSKRFSQTDLNNLWCLILVRHKLTVTEPEWCSRLCETRREFVVERVRTGRT
ncbi:hypothetical protein AVEN_271948-1 [Araneus ventricosus]|uniref:Secreted protein n=1 Tax=Araneus ventricosus TaxID=182803 RepID=A0A4Y2CBU3_ARAVE|nr:hypothetical protein AVEN_271948-1 [Araneus ventricosus]